MNVNGNSLTTNVDDVLYSSQFHVSLISLSKLSEIVVRFKAVEHKITFYYLGKTVVNRVQIG